MPSRKLPYASVATFSIMRRDNYAYVDKTAIIHKMLNDYRIVFFARPRRFGKSLTCSTLESIFKGQRELFKGLAIDSLPWDWKEYPVLHISLTGANYSTGASAVAEKINRVIDEQATQYGIAIPQGGISNRFAALMNLLYEAKGEICVIIDEYDKPLLETLGEPAHDEIKNELKSFYEVLKGCDKYLKFVFITGITKFAQVSMFSGLNQPKDISFELDCSELCGIAQTELEIFFEPEINEYSARYGGKEEYLARLKNYYNGYKFSGKANSVYNPVSLMNHFGDGNFRAYWAETGTPSFLAKYIGKQGTDIVEIENVVLPAEAFGKYGENEVSLVPLLYQAGYLTITDYNEITGLYTLNYPNTEVRNSFADFLSSKYSGIETIKSKSLLAKLINSLLAGDCENFMNSMKIYMSGIKYDLVTKITEYYFEFAFGNILNMLGVSCEIEVHTNIGSVDAVIKLANNVYIIEAKLDKPINEAIDQIEKKQYYLPYLNKGCNIFKIAVVFGKAERNIVEWKAFSA